MANSLQLIGLVILVSFSANVASYEHSEIITKDKVYNITEGETVLLEFFEPG